MNEPQRFAPGQPGIPPRWTSSAKSAVGTALSEKSRVCFTLSHGIFNEIYYPDIDKACTRDMGMLVTDGNGLFSEEKRDTVSVVRPITQDVAAFQLTNSCDHYQIEKTILTDPQRDTVLQKTKFTPKKGSLSDHHLYLLVSPHLANQGYGNTAWVETYDGIPLLMAQRDGSSMALACSTPFLRSSVGFVGVSDGWQDIQKNKKMTWNYTRAENGNVAMTAEIDLTASQGEFVLALGFGRNPDEAAQNALASLGKDFSEIEKEYSDGWNSWFKTVPFLKKAPGFSKDLLITSMSVLRVHESKATPGGLIASLAIPWGFSKGDNDLGGYHLVWTRDMVETAGAFLAIGARADALRAIRYLQATQKEDGHWSQNMWLDGSSYWNGIQMDETALPILLVDQAFREKVLTPDRAAHYWPMIRKAACFIVQNGPVSQQDRWEEDPGYTPFTIAAQIAALLAAADHADLNGEPRTADYLRQTADIWNDSIERWLYASNTDWCERFKVSGYYVRIVAENAMDQAEGSVMVKNVPLGKNILPASHLICPDALAFVRFGLRDAKDPRVLNTLKVIDALLTTQTPQGPVWHRYNDDGYGEHEDGSPFDGTGIGRGWPLLTGERAHYEMAAGHWQDAEKLVVAMGSFANDGHLIPEQVWDSKDIPSRELFFGRPSGSAMPLVWAHAEYLKLNRSLVDQKVFDMPPQTIKRYLTDKTRSDLASWRFNHKIRSITSGKKLRIESLTPAVIHWSSDNWKTVQDVPTRDTGLGMHIADLPTDGLPQGGQVVFTFYWPQGDQWEKTDYTVSVEAKE